MSPRVQTFAWRLLRKALPTGKRAGKFSKHIQPECSRCGLLEDEMHMLFLCPFSKAAWFCHPWYIRTETLAALHHNIPGMIQFLLSSSHPQINVDSLYTFLWCLWKARNDCLFNRKCSRPIHVFAASNAIMQGSKLEGPRFLEDNKATKHSHPSGVLAQITSNHVGNSIFCDAA